MMSLLLFLSAFIPMYALLFIQMIVEIINGNRTFNVLNVIITTLLIVAITLGTIGLVLSINKKHHKTEQIKVIKTTNITDQHFFAYISIFILFTLSFDISNMAMFITTVLILVIIGFVYIHNNPFPFRK